MLRSALEFAKSGSEAGGGAEAEASMQVDSPCPSPASLTPAHSLSSLAPAAAAPGDPQLEAREDGDSGHSLDTAMEVETAEPVATTAEAAVPTQPPKPRFVSGVHQCQCGIGKIRKNCVLSIQIVEYLREGLTNLHELSKYEVCLQFAPCLCTLIWMFYLIKTCLLILQHCQISNIVKYFVHALSALIMAR